MAGAAGLKREDLYNLEQLWAVAGGVVHAALLIRTERDSVIELANYLASMPAERKVLRDYMVAEATFKRCRDHLPVAHQRRVVLIELTADTGQSFSGE